MLARSAYESVVSAVHAAVVQRNASRPLLLELVEDDNRLEVFLQGLIFPCLTMNFNPATSEIGYRSAAREAGGAPEQGTIVPGYAGNVLLIDKNGVAHRITTRDLALTLLAPATASELQRVA